MSVKDCHHHGHKHKKLLRRILTFILIATLLILITILIIWAILRPTKPTFILQDVTVYALNASTTPNFLTSNFQVTITSRNPNDQIGIYYDKLDIYATYHDQQVTLSTGISPTYQSQNEANVWSPLICGTAVPIAPYNSILLNQEQNAGCVTLLIKADGLVRWKFGTITSGTYHLHVRCPAYITFGSRSTGIIVSENVVKYQMAMRCTVSG